MHRFALLASLAFLSGCGDDLSDTEREARNRAAADQVRALNDAPPPLVEIVPEPLLLPEIEANDLYGDGCAYAPGTSMGTRVIAREADAFMKIDDRVVRFAADPGSRELPDNSRSLYNGREYSLRLTIDDVEPGEEAGANTEGVMSGTVYLRDRWDRVVYQGSGAVNCGNL
ncbi:hypothetical protein [Aurantiacibacter spongiae]|uniref:Uncharacterized protein n=1 Tax=Aurantiacibacter spongiae TaxID=2488860 RepID=A0A3N5DI07_9SPHN|nr:hypothetical protein [Aurantiacibacter spongiae]RPF70245.1 hypothetical protein EG799_00325 [Aurantiacibacter spongiae]